MEGKKVLIIEDDLDMVEALRIILGGKGYEVASATSADEGFEMVKGYHPDIIILDVMMETRDAGFQLTYRLKNNPEYKDIPILMLTAVGKETGFSFSPKTDEEWLPVDDFMEKPIKPKEFLERVERLLSGGGQTIED